MTKAASSTMAEPATTAAEIIIKVEGLTVQFGQEVAVQGVTFEIPRGSIFGFIGPSGSGKTTTVRLLTGFYRPNAGQVTVLGLPPTEFKQDTRAKIGYMPQLFALYPELTVWENLNFAASIYGMSFDRAERLNQLLAFVHLTEHKSKLARNLSGGMQRRLSLAATLVHDPELIFLDEPTAGIDPVLRRRLWDRFKELQQAGSTLFVTTQYVGEAAYCDYIGVMAMGRLLMVETPEGLRQRAFGGEVVDLHTGERLTYKDLQTLRKLPFVTGKVTRLNDNNGIRLIVDKASTAIPALLEWCQHEYVTAESIEEYLPPFDDVFVELVKEVPIDE
ncbi:MAG TPA: ABC transporter ATP-binding protein [Anaerolineae bacterium]